MDSSQGTASAISTKTRTIHRHDFPGVDVPPQGGAAVAGMQARALREADGYVLSGSKIWISNAAEADYIASPAAVAAACCFCMLPLP